MAFALDTFGDRWSLVIVRDLIFRGGETYGDFLGQAEQIATNVLADRLRYLEADGVIQKFRDPDNRRRNIYRLTEKGLALAPIILEMVQWSAKYDTNTDVTEKLLKKIRIDRDGFLQELRGRVKLA